MRMRNSVAERFEISARLGGKPAEMADIEAIFGRVMSAVTAARPLCGGELYG
jgi:hypothetical protein